MKLALGLLFTLGCVLLLPISVPLLGILFLWDGWPRRDKPAVRPRKGQGKRCRPGAFFNGDTLAVPVGTRRTLLVCRRRRGWRVWRGSN